MTRSSNSTISASALSLLEKAQFFESLGEHTKAEDFYAEAVDSDGGSVALNEACSYDFRQGRLNKAIDGFSQLLVTARRTSDEELQSTALNNLAACYRELGDVSVASRFQQRALAAGHTSGLESNAAFVSSAELANLANDAILDRNFDLAEKLIEESLTMEIESANAEGQASDWATLGLIAGFQGKLSVAIERLHFAYRIHVRIGDNRLAARDMKNMAEVYAASNQVDSAMRYTKRARSMFDQLGEQEEVLAADERLVELAASGPSSVTSIDPLLN